MFCAATCGTLKIKTHRRGPIVTYARAYLTLILGLGGPSEALASQFLTLDQNFTPTHQSAQAPATPDSLTTDQRRFQALIEATLATFQSHAAAHRARLTSVIHWNSSGAGAFTLRKDGGTTWEIWFYDGITRLPYVTPDLILSVACHEVGHHLGGYPFKANGWAAAEGQADYFAIHACLPAVWEHLEENPLPSDLVEYPSPADSAPQSETADPDLASRCQRAFREPQRLATCLRAARLMAAVRLYEGGGTRAPPRFDTPDLHVVSETVLTHPSPQCRLDTQIAAMLCGRVFDFDTIPGLGRDGIGRNSAEAELDSSRYLCGPEDTSTAARRPLCWFAPLGSL